MLLVSACKYFFNIIFNFNLDVTTCWTFFSRQRSDPDNEVKAFLAGLNQ